MRLAIMQPYFLPYIGYWQLLAAVDKFVVYDNIKYTKKGWINRNRLLVNGEACTFSVPLAKASDELDVAERRLAESFNRSKLLAQFVGAYCKAPHFEDVRPLLVDVVMHPASNLFDYLLNSIVCVCKHLGVSTPLVRSSTIAIDHALKGQDKVLAICSAMGATEYLNAEGGLSLYERSAFTRRGVALQFLRSSLPPYKQWAGSPHVPWLSIVDVLMFNPISKVQLALKTDWQSL